MTILKIERLPHNKFLPEYKTEGAAGMDLCAAISEPITLQPLERKLIPTGLKIELEHGYEAQVRPRSVCVPIVNVSNEAYTIEPDERIAQMVIARVEQAEIKVAVELSETSRGEGGFGSTGK